MKIGNAKQLFVYDAIVDRYEGVTRVLHEAQREPGPVLWADRAWEHMGVWIYGSVLQEERTGGYTLWYQSNAGYPEGSIVCYATSKDGRHWHKPELGAVEWRGSRANNIVWGTSYDDAYCPSVIHDLRDPDPARRYKLYTWDMQTPGRHPNWPGFGKTWTGDVDRPELARGMWLATSPDGIHFVPFGEGPLVSQIGDVLPTIYDQSRDRFLSFTKINEVRPGDPLYRRSVGISTSPDGLRWTPARLVLTQDEVDDAQTRAMGGERTEFYGMSGFPYEGIYVGLLWVFHIMRFKTRPDKGRGWDDGPLDVQLTCSLDGEAWERAFSREPVIPARPTGNFDHSIGAVINRPLVTEDEILVYYSGSNQTHGVDAPRAWMAIGLARFRRDGFVSAGCGPHEGSLLTRPFVVEGRSLELNLDAHRGWARVALLHPDGSPIDGFSAADCDLLTEDRIRYPVTWLGRADLSGLQNQEVRMRVVMRHANLYAFRVVEDSSAAPTP